MLEQQAYLNPELSRSMLAQELEISEGYLSEIISQFLNTNFNDYVNTYRIEQAILLFKDTKYDLFSIDAIGYESGFKSKSVFYSAFKKVTGKTPRAYRKAIHH